MDPKIKKQSLESRGTKYMILTLATWGHILNPHKFVFNEKGAKLKKYTILYLSPSTCF